jgi:hypothetical protein
MRIRSLVPALVFLALLPAALSAQSEPAPISIWAERHYRSEDNPLHSEISVNGTTANAFTADTFGSLQGLKDGWNTITVKTTPQVPASKNNWLVFRIGPMRKDPGALKAIMAPVLWEFDNGADWSFQRGGFSHPLGPEVKDVTLTYAVYYAGLANEKRSIQQGDYVLSARGHYAGSNVPITATIWINGTPLNTFTRVARQLVVTSLLHPGKNEVKLVSKRVPNSIKANDVEFDVAGPAEWNAKRKRFVVTPIVQFKAMQGWTRDGRTGRLVNSAKPDSDTVERVISFMIK